MSVNYAQKLARNSPSVYRTHASKNGQKNIDHWLCMAGAQNNGSWRKDATIDPLFFRTGLPDNLCQYCGRKRILL